MPPLTERLAQRKIVQWGIAYLAGAWVLLQVLDFLAGHFSLPSGLVRAATVFLAIGLLGALVIAWHHGEQGQQRAGRAELSLLATILIIAVGAAAITYRRTPSSNTGDERARAASSGALTTVAVLPFDNVSGDPQDEYFSDGMTDELAHALGQIPELRVAGRTSSYAFKDKAVPVPEIGKALDVGGVIEGTVRRSGSQLRVTAQLANSADGKVIWTHTYQSGQTDVFVVQDSFTQAIVNALLPHLRGGAAASAAEQGRGTADQTAYDLYMRGRFFWAKRGADNLDRAADYFQQASAKDPRFARAQAALAMVYGVLRSYRADPTNSTSPLVFETARNALALDSTLADAHLAMGVAHEAALNLRGAEAEFRAAIRLDPSSPQAHQWLGEILLTKGKVDESVLEAKRALDLDRLSAVIGASYGSALVQARRFNEGAVELRRALELDPSFVWGYVGLATAQVFTGHPDSAVALLEPVQRRDANAQAVPGMLVLAYAAGNRWRDARKLSAELHKPGGDRSGGAHAAYADFVLGDPEPLLRMIESRDGQRLLLATFGFLGCNPMIEPLRKQPRFKAAMQKIGIEICALSSPWPVQLPR